MKNILILLLAFTPCSAFSQALELTKTQFVSAATCCTIGQAAIATADKGILTVGYSRTSGGVIPSFPLDTSLGNALVVKIDSVQHINWAKVFGGSKDDMAMNACQTADGGYAVLARTTSSDGDITGFKGGPDIWLLRLDADGNLLWQRTYGTSQSDLPISIANTSDGGFIIFGCTNGDDGDVSAHYGGFFDFDWIVIKTDGTGNVQWSRNWVAFAKNTTGEENNTSQMPISHFLC